MLHRIWLCEAVTPSLIEISEEGDYESMMTICPNIRNIAAFISIGLLTAACTASIADTAAPATPNATNLALNKKYESSDPNKYSWGIGGLTDGSWEASNKHCFASGDAAEFPKSATVDLEAATQVASVVLGVPAFGSTKTIEVSVSADGKEFKLVGTHVFLQSAADKFTYSFPAVSARFIRIGYPDHYAEKVAYPQNFVFTTEAEVYAPSK